MIQQKDCIKLGVAEKNHLKSVGLYLGFLAFFLAVYYSVFAYSFAFTDTYTAMFNAFHHGTYSGVESVYAGGRPLYALLNYAFCLTPDLESLKFLRLVSIAGIASLALFFTHYIQKNTSLSLPVSISIAAMIGLAPAFQVYATWAVCAFYPWAALLAAVSFLILDNENSSTINRVILSFFILCIATTIYQPAAMMFWVPAAISWLVADKAFPSIKQLSLAATIMLASLAVDFLLSKTLPHLIYAHPAPLSRTALVSHFLYKIIWFLRDPMRDALNLISFGRRIDVAIFVLFFTVFGMSRSFSRPCNLKVKKFTLAFFLLLGAYLPNLIVAENFASHRSQVALTSIVVVYAAMALIAWLDIFKAERLKTPLFISVLIYSGYIAGHSVLVEFAKPQTQELKLLSAYLTAHDNLDNATQIYLAPSSPSDSLAPSVRHDEFGCPSSVAVWALQGMVWRVLYDHHAPAAKKIESALSGPLANAPKGATIVDFSQILKPQ